MGFLQRLFGLEKPSPQPVADVQPTQENVPPERMGLHGEYDQSGLAKRVAAAFDEDPQIDDINTLYVAQTGNTVVLRGSVPNQSILRHVAEVARRVKGAGAVDTSQVNITS